MKNFTISNSRGGVGVYLYALSAFELISYLAQDFYEAPFDHACVGVGAILIEVQYLPEAQIIYFT